MTPEEITALFAEAANKFSPIAGAPTDDDLTALRKTLYPLLLSIPYDEDGTHNLIGLIEPPASYIATWGEAFPVPARPPAYDPAIAADARKLSEAWKRLEEAKLEVERLRSRVRELEGELARRIDAERTLRATVARLLSPSDDDGNGEVHVERDGHDDDDDEDK